MLATLPDSITVTSSPVALAKAHNAAESECLAEVLYYEARGEGMDGEKAVAEVVLQRTQNPDYPETVCGVVYDGVQPDRHDCQFSFACDGSLRKPKDRVAWQHMQVLAEKIMTGEVRLSGLTRRAIAYHSVDVTPAWADTMQKTAQIGNHVFYKRETLAQAKATDVPATPIESLSGFFTEAVGMSAVVRPSEEVQPQVQIAGAVGNGT
ncbi:MAG TPA: cell wall hydrolase [Micropepsaceae bacterium]|nr:cell wall hydrolase [Micropepsaceae bacterium]